ncbi:MAG TPA: alginate export family protein [Novosphingobium sp.]|nr:alginate export family protein [Novosphingobium sp.]
MKLFTTTAAALCAVAAATPALAAPGDPVPMGDGLTFDPIIDGRLRYENVDTPTLEADALTLRLRAGFEVKHKAGLSFLAEAEGTLAAITDYNAFGFTITDSQRRPAYAVVADPMNVELNRLQVQYKSKAVTVTLGRQRINLDDQRFVGSVGWRQNEQTFDALRGEARIGPVSLDATYATSQRTILGIDAGPRLAYDGDFAFLGAGAKLGPVSVKAFAYLLDYDPAEQLGALATSNADTQTYGLRAVAGFKLTPKVSLNMAASYARQSPWQDNTASYGLDYIAAEAGLSAGPIGLTAGYEKLGSNGTYAVQTPMATLHKFNGWADLFLTTPANGLEDWYGGISAKFPKVKALPGLNAAVTYHSFDSDVAGLHYGSEWDASLGFRLGRTSLLVKAADYNADSYGADTRKVWVQLEFAY